jgi:hypothetical protein
MYLFYSLAVKTNSCGNMTLRVTGTASQGGEECQPVIACHQPDVQSNVRGFHSLFF